MYIYNILHWPYLIFLLFYLCLILLKHLFIRFFNDFNIKLIQFESDLFFKDKLYLLILVKYRIQSKYSRIEDR